DNLNVPWRRILPTRAASPTPLAEVAGLEIRLEDDLGRGGVNDAEVGRQNQRHHTPKRRIGSHLDSPCEGVPAHSVPHFRRIATVAAGGRKSPAASLRFAELRLLRDHPRPTI